VNALGEEAGALRISLDQMRCGKEEAMEGEERAVAEVLLSESMVQWLMEEMDRERLGREREREEWERGGERERVERERERDEREMEREEKRTPEMEERARAEDRPVRREWEREREREREWEEKRAQEREERAREEERLVRALERDRDREREREWMQKMQTKQKECEAEVAREKERGRERVEEIKRERVEQLAELARLAVERLTAEKDLVRGQEREAAREALENVKRLPAAMRAELDALQKSHDAVKKAHAPCPGMTAGLQSEIDALRRQIKETKDALELDDSKFQDITAKVQAETADRQKHLESHIKLAAAAPTETKGGRVKLRADACPQKGSAHVLAASSGKTGLEIGAMDVDGDGVLSKQELESKLRNMGWSMEEVEKTFKVMDRDGDGGISANEYEAFCQMEDKNLEFRTLNGIANLRKQLADRQAKLEAFASNHASKDQEIENLQKRLAATEKQLAEEKRKEEELEANQKTKAELDKDEKDLAEDKEVIVKKDAEIKDLRKQMEIRTRSAEQLRSTLRGANAVAGSLVAQTSQAVEACAASVFDFKKYKASAKKRARGLERANSFLREAVQDMNTRVEPLVAMTQENARGMAEIVSDLQGNFAHQEQELKQSALSRSRLGEVHELVMLLVRDLAVAEIQMEQCKMEAVMGLAVLERRGEKEQVLRETLSERLGEQLADCRQRQLAAEESEGELNVAYKRLLTTHRELQGTLECKIKELTALDRTQNNLSWENEQLGGDIHREVHSRSVQLEAATPPSPLSLSGWALLASARAMRELIEAEEKVRRKCIYVYTCKHKCVYIHICINVFIFTCID
jgi:hypothetical protein